MNIAITASQPVIASRGTNTVVRNTKGKNSRKLELTAAGLPVLKAIAYPKPVNAKPQQPDSSANSSTPSSPDSKRTPTMKPIAITGSVSATTSAKSATVSPNSIASRLMGVSARRSK